jgi:two-component system sensor histidine kinase BaeS
MGATVLVVEDDGELRELLRRYLERAGYAVHTTGSGVEGIRLLGSGGVDLAVVDLGLPDVDGFVSRRLTGPLVRLAGAADRFAAGDRSARSGVRAPGELGGVARAFDAMADRVERAETVRRQLAADVAHELRTPLAGLQAGLEELRDGLVRPDPARLAGLHDQVLRLGRVVDDLAELSATESAARSLRPVEVDLAALVRSALAGHEPTLRAAGLDVTTDLPGPVPVRVDPDRIQQAVVNLLANAARYCRSGDRVAVTVSTANGMGSVEVADTGPGIPAADLPHVFQRLWRGSGSHQVTGSGIGLAVVRELVAAHHGTVTAASTTGAGARFTIRLPLAAPHR